MSEPNKYRRIVELGRGGMAVVHLTAMRSSHDVTKLVVVKELQANLAADPEYRAMFLDEARLAARLNHPNVVQTFEIVDHVGATASDGLEGVCALVMEYLEGQPLNRIRARLKADPRGLGVSLIALTEVLTGLEYAHQLADYQGKPLGIVHRDMSPHNVFVTYSGAVKVVDFGIAKANDASSAPTQVGTVKGKLAYMAPEQARGDRIDGRADVFACGVMLWEASVGRRLWAGMNDAAIMYKLLQADIPSPRSQNPKVPEALDAICRRALAHDPAQRYASAAQFRDDLEAFVTTMPERPTRRILGELVTMLFAEERAQVKRVVEEQLGRAAAAPTDQFSAMEPTRELPRLPIPKDSASSVTEKQSGSTKATSAASVTPPPRIRTGVLVGAGAAVLAVGAIIGVAFVHGGTEPSTAASAATSSAVAVASPQPAASSGGRRVLAVDPPSARVTLDGAPLPLRTTSIDGGPPAMLHVEADGYAPADLRVTFDTRDPIIVHLVPLPTATTATAAPLATHHPPPPHPTPHPTPTAHPTSHPTGTSTDVGY